MAVPEPLGLTRRTVLTGAAALLAAGTAGFTVARPGRAANLPQIRAAAAGWIGRGGELLVLTADPATEADYALRLLKATENPESGAELGPPLPLPLPSGFHPHSMAALGSDLWITGATELAPDQARPALVRLHESMAAYVALPVPKTIRSGIATGIAPVGERGLAVAVEGCPDPHLAVITCAHLLRSADFGRTWTERPLATGLGEGYGTVLTSHGEDLFVAVGGGDGAQTIHTARPRAPLTRTATIGGAGRPMAAVAAEGHVSVFSDHHGTVTESRFTTAGAPLEAAPACACQGEIHAVPGRPGTWLETDGQTIHIRGTS
ncbi:hypothetical protein [Glycomyces algeriensis]|uniref:Uncharacterized protein n=1 Tax=Glycomyces algeriensis TaxID=256037 RepID=A0A9W6G5Q6_9ACTN|nr:hypothetical protein [Glycomyces algeriensis]MDA1367567.1 hypothetical protein [Glycomyces algeriensis]MDR7353070.1 hypothetical protein [Glycomyces algeriensis]GLI40763.1 hypothetical protein GALLR39Z86_06130 [Glycomyces algeriensis]